MLNTEMLFRMRSFLDEATASFYTDSTELYVALSLAQLEVAVQVSNNWKQKQLINDLPVRIPKTLHGIRTVETGTIGSGTQAVAISADPLEVITVQWQFDGAITVTTRDAIEMAEGGDTKRVWLNTLTADGTYFYFTPNLLTVHPISTNASAGYTIVFLDTPVDITASVQPELDSISHDCIIERALWILLKDRETEQANIHLQMYSALLKGLMK